MNVLITGGMGNLGSRLLIPLVRRKYQVVLFDRRPDPLIPSPEFEKTLYVEGDVTNLESITQAVKLHEIDVIFHLASLLSAQSELESDLAWEINMTGTRNVLEAARLGGVSRVTFSSSLATYGPGIKEPLEIDAPMWPASLYGVTKVASECLGNYYHLRFGMDFRSIRFPTLVAPRGASGAASAFCSAIFVEAVEKGAFNFEVGPDATFPAIYIGDAIRAFLLLFDAPNERLSRRVYNVHGLGLSARDLSNAILRILPDTNITYTPNPTLSAIVDSWPQFIDDSMARIDWDWKSDYDLDRMAIEIITQLRNRSYNENP